MKPRSQYRLAWSVCLLLLIGFIASSFSNYWVSRENVRKTITESSLPLTSDNIYSVIQRDLLKPIFISSMMSTDTFLRFWLIDGEKNLDQIQLYLQEIVREYDTITSFLVSEKTRNYYYAGGLLKQIDQEDPRDEWYFRVREMDAPFEINVDPDFANQDEITIFINYRVFDFDGNYIGVTGTGLTVNHVNHLIEEYEERFSRQIFFCDQNGRVILATKNSSLNNYTNIREVPGLDKYADSLLDSKTKDIVYRKNSDTYFLNSRFISELGWFLVVKQTEDELLAPLRRNLYYNLALALVITAIVAALCLSMIRSHQKKLLAHNKELSEKNQKIEEQKQCLQDTADELSRTNQTLSRLNQEKDDFLGIVAHDLRNPLGSILGFCEEIKLQLPPERKDLQEYLTYMEDASRQMLDLTGDILDVSEIEGSEEHFQLEQSPWNELIEKAISRFMIAARRKSIVLDTILSKEANINIETRTRWVDICLNNLISNAVKYAPRHTRITILSEIADGHAVFSIEDEGEGIPVKEQKNLFKKFARGSSQPTGTETSTGLGLYIVKNMCDRLGATIEVHSKEGSGSRFVIRHPLESTPSQRNVP